LVFFQSEGDELLHAFRAAKRTELDDQHNWHKGQPEKPGWQGKDHWHNIPGGVKDDRHYKPGDIIKRVTVGAAVLSAAILVGDAIASYWPVALFAF
jgi:hypothetical protein